MQISINLDTQYEDAYTKTVTTPEQRLIAAIIRRAIFDAYAYTINPNRKIDWTNCGGMNDRQAYVWLNSKSKKKYSFHWWAEQAGLNYSYLQSKIRMLNYKLDKSNCNNKKKRNVFKLKNYQ